MTLVCIGILIGTAIRFYLLVKDYGIKTTIYITVVNLAIAVVILIVALIFCMIKNEIDKKRENREKKP